MKENNGKAATQRFWKQISAVISITFFVIGLIGVLDVRRSKTTRSRFRRKQQIKSEQQHQINPNSNALRDGIPQQQQFVADALFTLVDIVLTPQSFIANKEERYKGVIGVFCPIQWELHRSNPSKYPMFRDLIEASQCSRQSIRMDLWTAVQQAKSVDAATPARTKVLQLGGMVFHESRCGSTLVANALVASYPDLHRVYSESPPPITALHACEDDTCDESLSDQLLTDVLYLMSRTTVHDTAEKVFFKIQSIGTVGGLEKIARVFPTLPWAFVYRDPVQVMMSHLPDSRSIQYSNCLRTYHRPTTFYRNLIQRMAPTKSFDTLTYEEHCAAHLAQITESARSVFSSHATPNNNNKGVLINYEDLPQALIDTVFPNHFQISTNNNVISTRILEVCTHYSKGRGKKEEEWVEDSQKKLAKASDAVREASDLFLGDTYEWMKNA